MAPGMLAVIESKLSVEWSPEQGSGGLLADQKLLISHRSIYCIFGWTSKLVTIFASTLASKSWHHISVLQEFRCQIQQTPDVIDFHHQHINHSKRFADTHSYTNIDAAISFKEAHGCKKKSVRQSVPLHFMSLVSFPMNSLQHFPN